MEHYPAGNFNLEVDRLCLAIKGQSEVTHLCGFAFKLCSFDIKGLFLPGISGIITLPTSKHRKDV